MPPDRGWPAGIPCITGGTALAAAAENPLGGTRVQVWNLATGKQAAAFEAGGEVDSLAFGPGGKTLAVAGTGDFSGEGGTVVQVRDLGTSRLTSLDVSGTVESVAFSPDGKTLAVGTMRGGPAGTVQLWDMASHKLTATVAAAGTVGSLAFSPDGNTLAFSVENPSPQDPEDSIGTVQLWDTATQQQIASPVTSDGVVSLAFTPDGKTLTAGSLSFSESAAAQQWDLAYLADPVSYLCAQAAGTLSRAQWAQDTQGLPYQDICP